MNFNDFLLYDDTMQMSSMKNYVISRKAGIDADEDPMALDFFPEKGSDELYEALKEAFPAQKTHKDRMREAVFDFLLHEREQEAMTRTMSNATSFNTVPESTMPSPAYFIQQGSLQSTPDYLPSPESQFTNTFPSTPAIDSEISAIPNSMSVPGLREMTTVWSVSSSSQPKVRTRRAMTEAEKKEYRRKRADGACADCRRRRRKCDHESSESDSSSKVVKKVRKTAKATTGTTVRQRAPASAEVPNFLGQSSTGTSPSLSNNVSPTDMTMELPSSMLWPEDGLFDFSGIDVDADFLNSSTDPLFDFVDFNQGSDAGDQQQQITVANGSFGQHSRLQQQQTNIIGQFAQDVWSSTAPQAQPQRVPSSSGMIMPLPSYYAHTEVSQDPTSTGGTVSSPVSPTNMPLAQQPRHEDVALSQRSSDGVQRQVRAGNVTANSQGLFDTSTALRPHSDSIAEDQRSPDGERWQERTVDAIARRYGGIANGQGLPDQLLDRDGHTDGVTEYQRSPTGKHRQISNVAMRRKNELARSQCLPDQLSDQQLHDDNFADNQRSTEDERRQTRVSTTAAIHKEDLTRCQDFPDAKLQRAAKAGDTGATPEVERTRLPPDERRPILPRVGAQANGVGDGALTASLVQEASRELLGRSLNAAMAMTVIAVALLGFIAAQSAAFSVNGFTAMSLLVTVLRATCFRPSGTAVKYAGGQLRWRRVAMLIADE